jgi:tetratricopeptide (TPR) repeat protein
VPLLPDLACEHRLYLPLAAVIAAVVAAAWEGWRAIPPERLPAPARRLPQLAVLAVALASAVLVLGRSRDYESEESIWSDTLRTAPHNPRAHQNLAGAYSSTGRPLLALAQIENAIALRPDSADFRYNKGLFLTQCGRPEEALLAYSEALARDPNHAASYNNRANAFSQLERYEEAVADYRRALALAPGYLAAYRNRAKANYELGRYALAWEDVRRVRELGGEVSPVFLEKLRRAAPPSTSSPNAP